MTPCRAYRSPLCALLLILLAGFPGPVHAGSEAEEQALFFREKVRPILEMCVRCHGKNRKRGGLDLRTRASALAGGDRGPALSLGNLTRSLLLKRVKKGEMPPRNPLTANQVADLQRWIAAGAVWKEEVVASRSGDSEARAGLDWWALQPIQRSPVPAVRDPSRLRTPVDAFILARLEVKGLQLSPEADRATLLRRLSFDLTGLPPTVEDIRAFVTDTRPDAYERLVDRLLASPAYGERWARHWLDIARFGESQGFERDKLRANAWPYREYVIGACNDDRPYTRFVAEQIAGDVLGPGSPDGVAATSFLVCGPYDEVGNGAANETVRLQAREEALEDILATVGQAFLGMTVHCARCHDHKFDPIPRKDYYRLKAVFAGVYPGERPYRGGLVYAVQPKKPAPTHVLVRGDPRKKQERVAPGTLSAVKTLSDDLGLDMDAPEGARRRKLAEWITDPRNPLPARVLVNRLWHHHFGLGLVSTPSDFGFNGARPSHPALLDWLASEFIASGWSIKHLHRLLVLSAVYRQGATVAAGVASQDASNVLLWRWRSRRLEGEEIRDAMLAISGRLNRQMGGPSYQPFTVRVFNSHFYTLKDPPTPEFERRTIYRMNVLSARSPLLESLDCPDPATRTPKRASTTTPLQALALMNNSFVLRQAKTFARRVAKEAGPDPGEQVALAYRLALGRGPSKSEATLAEELVREHGVEQLCWVLFNSSEFLYAR